MSPAVCTIVDVIEKLIAFVDEIPPVPQSARYGNVAYRTWHDRMSSDAESFMLLLLSPDLRDAAVELVPYFTDSFGNSSRINYGNYSDSTFFFFNLGVVLLFVIFFPP